MDAVTSSEVFLFDRFRLDRRGGGLFRRSDTGQHLPVTIGSRALEVLGVLIERRGDLVSKDEIMRAVWPGTVVEEANLTFQISALRRILDAERAGGSCIQTVPGRGYRLVLSVTQPGDAQTGPALAVPPAHPVARPEAAAPPRPRRQPWLWPAVGLSGLRDSHGADRCGSAGRVAFEDARAPSPFDGRAAIRQPWRRSEDKITSPTASPTT